MIAHFVLAAAVAAAPRASRLQSPADSSHCLDSFYGAGALFIPPDDVARGIQHSRPDRIVRVDVVAARSLPDRPIVGFLYVSQAGRVLFSTRRRANFDPAAAPLVREIYAAASTATAAQLARLLAHQNGNAVLFLRRPEFLKRLPVVALPCVVLSKDAPPPRAAPPHRGTTKRNSR